MNRTVVTMVALVLSLSIVSGLRAEEASEPKVQLDASLDAAQEVPSPTGTSPQAGGTATFTFDTTDNSISYTISAHDLTGNPTAGHIHKAPPGTAGDVVVALPTLPKNDRVAVTGSVVLPAGNVQDLYDGGLYVNLHTPMNPGGEIRGQIGLKVPPACTCRSATSPKVFKSCVRTAVAGFGKDARKLAAVKALKKSVAKSSCGKSKVPKKAVACCLPQTPIGNVVIGHLCAAVPEKACAKLGGLGGRSLGAGSSCIPNNPCTPAAS